ncbi:MAG: S8 family serine peptidase [Deltaproteobacteria bacterium]|nr:S8 family serine peptidase [Deltaproteobacteria bacterium]
MQKVFVYVDSADDAGQRAVTDRVTEVLAVYGLRLLARATKPQLRAVEKAGYRVEVAEGLDRVALSGAVVDGRSARRAKAPAARRARAGEEPVPWVVQFVGPPLPEWVEALRGAGAEVLGPVPPAAVFVRMTATQGAAVSSQPSVEWAVPYEAAHKVHPDVTARVAAPAPRRAGTRAPAPPVALVATLFDAGAREGVVRRVVELGGEVLQASGASVRCSVPPSAVQELAGMPEVARVSPDYPTALCLQVARGITGAQQAFDLHGLDGEGEIVAVADTGLDTGVDDPTLHVDFWQATGAAHGRVVRGFAPEQVDPSLLPAQVRGAWSDPDGHGTHVAGIAVGNGRATADRGQAGVARRARVVMQSLLAADGTLAGIPPDLNDLFGQAYAEGARVHNNSWATTAGFAQYGTNTRAHQLDQFVWTHPDMVVVFAADNSSTDGPRGAGPPAPPVDVLPGAADGVADFASVSTEGTARNAVTVGGSENQRVGIWAPSPDTTWAGTWGSGNGTFGTPPLSTDPVADNPEHVMAISGRGPTVIVPPMGGTPQGDRIKPDVVAPGSSILSARSSVVPGPPGAFWGNAPPANYVYKGGTSMAAPHVTGLCAVIRQYLRRALGHSDPNHANLRRRRPSAALVKALLVHGARPIAGQNAANAGTVPGNHQGWGRVDLRRTLFPNPVAARIEATDSAWLPRRTVFVDSPDRTLNGLPVANPASRVRQSVRVTVADPSVPLRATLVWTDYPGAVAGNTGTLVNQLSLRVVRQSDGAAFPFALPAGLQPAPAAIAAAMTANANNVQQVDVSGASLTAGEYVVEVQAVSIGSVAVDPTAEQDFALVISGALSHSDHRNPGTLAALPDLAFVDFAPTSGGAARHDGLAPSPERPANDDGSPDLWLAREANPAETSRIDHAEAGTPCYVYARVRNLGFAPAAGAEVTVSWADPAGPLAWPGDWSAEGFRVEGVTGNRRTVDVPARTKAGGNWNDGATVVGPFEWDPPRGRERVALLVRATHPYDPVAREGDLRWDNNLTRRDVAVQDNTTQVQGEPSGWDRFLFWLISGFGSPRDIEARLLVSYQDLRDGQVKPVAAGVTVEVWDYDPVTADDRLAEGRTAASTGPDGRPASAVHLTFSTTESGERGPDLYVKVLRPAGAEFEEFLAASFFAGGAREWVSREIAGADGGFYREDFDGDRFGLDGSVGVVLRPAGLRVNAVFESFDAALGEFRPFPQGIPVQLRDANPDASPALLATAVTGESGAIAAVVPRRAGYNPSLYFRIEKDPANEWFAFVWYFTSEDRWDSREKQAEVVAAGGGVTAREGIFRNWAQDMLVAAGERLRFRLESPGIQVHLRFQYFDREAGTQTDLPAGTEVELWEDGAAGRSLVTAAVGSGGRLEATVPKGGRDRLDLFARVLMRRRLSAAAGDPLGPAAQVRKAGNLVHWDTRGNTAVGGASGTFTGAETAVGTAAAPLLFQIGTGPADANDEHAAPFVLKVLGDVHDWLRTRSGGQWTGGLGVTAELVATGAANGSTFDATDTIRFNTAHGGANPDHWSRAVISHHMGHLAFERFFLFPGRSAPTVPNHHGYDPAAEQPSQQRRVLAEGWADYVASSHRAPPARPDATANQTGWRGTDNNGANSSGEIVPVAVANALWRLDQDVVGRDTTGIADPLNQRRFQTLLWRAFGSLPAPEARQTPFELYRAIQATPLAADALIAPHDAAFVRQEVRRVFEANGLVFARGKIEGVNRVTAQNLAGPNPVSETWRVRAAPADRARLNVAALGRVAAYRVQARVAGQPAFVDLDPVVEVTRPDQKAEVVVNVTQARQSGVLASAGACDLRVLARDEFGAWDTFADDFTGNAAAAVTTNDQWQRDRLGSVRAGPGNVP